MLSNIPKYLTFKNREDPGPRFKPNFALLVYCNKTFHNLASPFNKMFSEIFQPMESMEALINTGSS